MSLIHASIRSRIDYEHECMINLLMLLKKEECALLEDNFNLIEELTVLKNNIVLELQRSAEKRFELFEQIQRGTQSFAEWLYEENNQEIYDAWQKLIHITSHAKEVNSTNSLILNQLALRNQRLLSFLNGIDGANMYGPDGMNMSNSLVSVIKG